MALFRIPLWHLRDEVFTKGSGLLARACPLTVRRELSRLPSTHVCCSRGNMLARLFLSFEETWLPQNSGPGSGLVEQVSGAVEGQWWVPAVPEILLCSVGQCRPQQSKIPVAIPALLL